MKKLITSAGLVVLGAASLKAQQVYAPAPGLSSTEMTKPWSVSAAVRGFYDDNYALTPDKGIPLGNGQVIKPQDSLGYEVTPSAALNWKMDQTYLGLSYVYDLKYYEHRENHKIDQSHQANVKLTHTFTDRYKIDLQDSFVSTSEPDLVAPVNAHNSTIRTRQDMFRNYGAATGSIGFTDELSAVLGYSNTLYDYRDSGEASVAALLNRMEHLASANLRWQIQPPTVVLVGYNFGLFDFNANQFTDIPFAHADAVHGLKSDQRNSLSHYAYLGVDHSFNPQLDFSLRLGAQLTDYYNLPHSSSDVVSPYADGSLTYHMTPDSWIQAGVRHSRIATDAAALDTENTTAYASINYRVLPPLTASLLAQFQYNTFQDGGPSSVGSSITFKDKAENFYLVGLNLAYEFNKFLAAEIGYNYDNLDSDIDFRSFSRNRVYVGLRASY